MKNKILKYITILVRLSNIIASVIGWMVISLMIFGKVTFYLK
jgi:hypothetical protein